MFDAKSLLDQFLGASAGAAGPGQQGGQAPGAPGTQPGTLLEQGKALLGGQGGQAGGLLQQGKSLLGGQSGGLATGALAGGLVSLLLGSKKARKVGGKALTYGGLALVGALAYTAYRNYQTKQAGPAGSAASSPPATGAAAGEQQVLLPPPSDTPFAPEHAPGGEAHFARAVLMAMIAAAKADGHIDAEEQRRIFSRIDQLGLGHEERAFVIEQLSAPLDINAIVAEAKTPEAAAELYAASLLAITPDQPAEKAYLDLLATRLAIPPALARELERAVAEAEAV